MKKRKKLWLIISMVLVVLLISALTGLYFYFYYYSKPNFEKGGFQKISGSPTGSVKPGDEITYTIDFENTGNTMVSDLTIRTIIPEHTEYVSSGPDADYDSTTGYITFNAGSIDKDTAGNVSFTVRVDNPLDNGIILKTGEVIFEYVSRNENSTFVIPDIIGNTVVSSPDLSEMELSFTDLNEGEVNMGDVIEFNISVKNTGNMNAKTVQVLDIWPDKFILDESSATPADKIDKNENHISWNIEELDTGDARTFKFKAEVGSGFEHMEAFEDIAQVFYEGVVVNEASIKGEVTGYPNFSESQNTVSDVDGGSTWAGDTLKYAIIVKNTGLRAGKDFKLICQVPANSSYVSNSSNPGEGANYDSGLNALVWTIDNLDAGQEKPFEFSVSISSGLTGGGTISSAFYIEGDGQYVELKNTAVNVRGHIYQTVVCMGDSQVIMTNWPAILDSQLESRYPRADYNTVGIGKGGQMSWQAVPTFDSTVSPNNPQVVVLGFGSNDAGYSVSAFADGMTKLIQKAKSIGATPIVHSIGYIDTSIWTSKANYRQYNDALKGVCAANGVPYVDIESPMAANPGLYLKDGLHWSQEGANLVSSLVFNTMVNYLDADGERK